jgi:crossover junction endodeoxyribonuclease RuvC
MRIIGIDPGLNVTGYGVVEVQGERCIHIAHGVVRTKLSAGIAARLTTIRDGVEEVTRQWQATESAIEASFVGENARSALALGHARGAAILGLAAAGIPVHEYSPAMVKQTVAGYGRGEKAQVAQMVRLQLSLAEIPGPADAADGLAIAITHWAHSRLEART